MQWPCIVIKNLASCQEEHTLAEVPCLHFKILLFPTWLRPPKSHNSGSRPTCVAQQAGARTGCSSLLFRGYFGPNASSTSSSRSALATSRHTSCNLLLLHLDVWPFSSRSMQSSGCLVLVEIGPAPKSTKKCRPPSKGRLPESVPCIGSLA